ncbi:MAG: fructosamine kinase family protein [Planctomycetes bacterium]|nr:fructosamine kinase family protein [Planctomycetota bacterium]
MSTATSASVSIAPPLPASLATCLAERSLGDPIEATVLAGGIINLTRRIRTSRGASLVVKQCRSAPHDFFPCEAEGLAALHIPDGWRVPDVLHVDHECLILEDLGEGHERSADYWEVLARSWAGLHQRRASRFGYQVDNYYGVILQDNQWREDGYAFSLPHLLGMIEHACDLDEVVPWTRRLLARFA